VVLDHIARVVEHAQEQPAVERSVRRLIDNGKTWVKLSAPYFSARDPESEDRLAATVSMLLDSYPDRLLWGSDWPHATETEKPDDARLLDFLLGGASARQLHQVLVENPKTVYGF